MVHEPHLADLYGIENIHTIDVDALHHPDLPERPLRVWIGFDAAHRPVGLDFERWSGLDDHIAVIATPHAGTTSLLHLIILGLSLLRTPDQAVFLVAEGKHGASEYADITTLPGCVGHVTLKADQIAYLADRLSQVLAGEVDRRSTILRTAGVDTFDDYQALTAHSEPLPQLFVVIDRLPILLPWVQPGLTAILTASRRLGIHVIAGVPTDDWHEIAPTSVGQALTGHVLLGLNRDEANKTLNLDIPEDLKTRSGCIAATGTSPQQFTVIDINT